MMRLKDTLERVEENVESIDQNVDAINDKVDDLTQTEAAQTEARLSLRVRRSLRPLIRTVS